MTGIVDENGKRFATYSYDSAGRAQSTQHAGGTQSYTLGVSTTTVPTRTVQVTDPRGILFNHDYTVAGGAFKKWRRYCSNCPTSMEERFTFDANGNTASHLDFNGNLSTYTYDLARNLQTTRTEGLTAAGGPTSATRTLSTRWHPTYRVPTQVAEPLRITTYTYDVSGNLLSKSVQATSDANGSQGFSAAWQDAPRVWTYTYNSLGQALTVDGPRTDLSDVTSYTYYPDNAPCIGCRGEVHTVVNALNQVTRFDAYDGNGRPTQITKVSDSAGDVIQYTLDALGNRLREDAFDPQSTLKQTHARMIDALNRLQQDIGGADPAHEMTQYSYDRNGNLLTTVDALARTTRQQYDARDRLSQVTDAANGVTSYGYDGLDQVIRVTDPRGLATQSSYSGLGDRTALSSPDTGTAQYSYDSAGNLTSATDAQGQTTAYTYDALNRIAVQQVAHGPTITYGYDQGSFALGRLSSVSDGAALTQWGYDAFGRVQSKTQTLHGRTLTVGYGYAPGGKLNVITYPSGHVATYGYDAAGRVNSVSLDGALLLSQVAYQPFGPPSGWSWGNGSVHQRFYDQDGRVTAIVFPPEAPDSQSFGYDALNRLTSAALSASGIDLGYLYDATGNRLQEMRNGALSDYLIASNSNQVQSIGGAATRAFGYDANGALTADNANRFTYDGRGRLIGANATTYYVSALGQRIEKAGPGATAPSGVQQFVYDEQGRLLGEYDAATGSPVAEHIYLNDWPIAVIEAGTVYDVHPDHLGAPHTITLPATNQSVWAAVKRHQKLTPWRHEELTPLGQLG